MHHSTVLQASLAALLLCATAAMAQPATPPAAAASATRGPGARFGADFTPGWAMMSSKERAEHRDRMRGARSADECRKLMDEHHKLLSERAKERGMKDLPTPRRNACGGYPPARP